MFAPGCDKSSRRKHECKDYAQEQKPSDNSRRDGWLDRGGSGFRCVHASSGKGRARL